MNIGVGILGFAHGHVNNYLAQWRQRPELGVAATAGWDHDAKRAADAGQKHGLAICASPVELLSRPDVQAVVVAAETSLHAELVEAAARAGKAIILQKPIALTMEQADRIVQVVGRSGVPMTLAWQMRVDPQNVRIKRLVGEGAVGKVVMVRRRHGLATHAWKGFDSTWHVDAALNRDIWADDAAHAIDFLYWLLGMPVSVTAELASLVNPKVPNDNGIAVFRYADGSLAEVCCSFTCLAGENTTEIVGVAGTIVQNYGDVPSANVPHPAGAPGLKWFLQGAKDWTVSDIPSPANHGERISGLAGPLAEFLHGRRPAIATAEEGRAVLRLVLACYDSSAQGRRVILT